MTRQTSAPFPRNVRYLGPLQHVLIWLLSRLLLLWGRTLRIQLSPQDQAQMENTHGSRLFLLWHNRLFFSWELKRRFRSQKPLCALVSASKDGAWLSSLLGQLGLTTARGSSSFRGAAAAKAMLAYARTGADLALTPDGPRGPLYQVKAGTRFLAQKAELPLVVLGIQCSKVWKLPSWDRFWIPWPFATLHLQVNTFANWEAFEQTHAPDLAEKSLAKYLNL